MSTTTKTNDVLTVAASIVSASKSVNENLAQFKAFFPQLSESELVTMALTMVNATTPAPVAKPVVKAAKHEAVSEPVIEEVEPSKIDTSDLEEVMAAPKRKGAKLVHRHPGRHPGRPAQLKMITPEGEEFGLVEAVQKVLGKRALSMPEIMEAFDKKGWKTNSHSDNFSQSIYLILNKKTDLFSKQSNPENRRDTTYQVVRKVRTAPVMVAPVVTKVEGKAPSSHDILAVIKRKFANKKFAMRDIAQVLGVEARTISVNTRILKENNIIKTVGVEKINGTGPEVMFYEMV